MTKAAYLSRLKALKRLAAGIPNTPMLASAKIDALVVLNMRYEKIAFNRALKAHPYKLTAGLLDHALETLAAWKSTAFIEDAGCRKPFRGKSAVLETKHRELFQALWVKFSPADYRERIDRYRTRLKLNGLAGGFLRGKDCIDLGCGHGNFAHALSAVGARRVLGIDFGKNSIRYARAAAKRLRAKSLEFRLASVYKLPAKDASFDFAVQNGVFHHLHDEDAAIREAARVLRPGGHLWYYTDGAGGIGCDLWDASVEILRDIPHAVVLDRLEALNIGVGKRYHLGDGLNATYRHTTYEEITRRLGRLGFENFRRLKGGFSTDLDGENMAKDPWAKEKFGAGDLRILCRRKS